MYSFLRVTGKPHLEDRFLAGTSVVTSIPGSKLRVYQAGSGPNYSALAHLPRAGLFSLLATSDTVPGPGSRSSRNAELTRSHL